MGKGKRGKGNSPAKRPTREDFLRADGNKRRVSSDRRSGSVAPSAPTEEEMVAPTPCRPSAQVLPVCIRYTGRDWVETYDEVAMDLRYPPQVQMLDNEAALSIQPRSQEDRKILCDQDGRREKPTTSKKRRRRRRRKRASAQASEQADKAAAPRHNARPAPPPASGRGGGGGPSREQEGRHSASSSGVGNIDALMEEAESRFRMALHAEMEAACHLLREALALRLQRDGPTAHTSASAATQTEETTKKKRMVINRASQTTDGASSFHTETTVRVDEGTQTSSKRYKRHRGAQTETADAESIGTQTEVAAMEPTRSPWKLHRIEATSSKPPIPRSPSPEVEDLGIRRILGDAQDRGPRTTPAVPQRRPTCSREFEYIKQWRP
ncbi:uncharacterized protein LOC126450696 [Schistocerca serialis cubense]|uniref:uncharacterized protein LOC126450696 n=1 Tax=Schistocerca serialis cubense TaxID=2023355 RepID=UPI00214F342E|nr:uncharacterized protein LOC126450696 [Schistocerca serialis cubense]